MNNKDFNINGHLVVACNYNTKGFYEFHDINNRIVARIKSDKIKLPKDNGKAWEKLAIIFGDNNE